MLLSFDGIDDHVHTSLIFNSPSSFTVAAWIKVPPQSTSKIVARTPYKHPRLWIVSNGSTRIEFTSSAGNPGVNSTIQVVDNNWHYLVGVWDGGTVEIYIDGNINNSQQRLGESPTVNTLYYFQIGGFGPPSTGLSNTLQGLIDEVRLYNRALSDSEIKVLYDVTK